MKTSAWRDHRGVLAGSLEARSAENVETVAVGPLRPPAPLPFPVAPHVGVASRVVPNFTGKPLWSPYARDAAFYLLNASMAVRALEVPIGFGVWPQAWNLIAWSGPLGVLAMLLFTMNIIMTIRQQPAALMQPAVSAQALQPLSTARQRS